MGQRWVDWRDAESPRGANGSGDAFISHVDEMTVQSRAVASSHTHHVLASRACELAAHDGGVGGARRSARLRRGEEENLTLGHFDLVNRDVVVVQSERGSRDEQEA
ncbi:MAG: hypothetical protein R3B99_30235 [Polyangiales bacterium]